MSEPKKVLVTGAYGLIGNAVYGRLAQDLALYDVYVLARRAEPSSRLPASMLHEIPGDRLRLAELADFPAVQAAVQGMEVVVHLAADPSGLHGWESVLASNVVGAYHVFEASRLAGVKRIVFASSIQVVFGYGKEEPYRSLFADRYQGLSPADIPPITHEQPTRPLNLYACSKVWGEALAHAYAYAHGMSCICLRIGWVVAQDRPPRPAAWFQWCSQRDVAQFVKRCIDAPESLRFDVFFGLSDNRYQLADIQHAREVLGYRPLDRAEDDPL